MKHTLLQVGDEIRAGDEYWSTIEEGWAEAAEAVDIGYRISDLDLTRGDFYRRPERRTEIEVMPPDGEDEGLRVSLGGTDGEYLDIEGYGWFISRELRLPISYAQKLIDAVKEVAGL